MLIDLASRISFAITQQGCPNKVPVFLLETTASVVEVEIDFHDRFFFVTIVAFSAFIPCSLVCRCQLGGSWYLKMEALYPSDSLANSCQTIWCPRHKIFIAEKTSDLQVAFVSWGAHFRSLRNMWERLAVMWVDTPLSRLLTKLAAAVFRCDQ